MVGSAALCFTDFQATIALTLLLFHWPNRRPSRKASSVVDMMLADIRPNDVGDVNGAIFVAGHIVCHCQY